MFHIDFGFIMGRDPKIFPPPMKLCKEMVEAMGGTVGPGGYRSPRHRAV
jgi:phosphatidylinositol 3-kinase